MQIKNYADPMYGRQIENENDLIYKRLVGIYSNCNCQSDHQQILCQQYKFNRQLVKFLARAKIEKRIQQENLKLLRTLINVKADLSLSRDHTEQSWSNHLRYKKQRLIYKQINANKCE